MCRVELILFRINLNVEKVLKDTSECKPLMLVLRIPKISLMHKENIKKNYWINNRMIAEEVVSIRPKTNKDIIKGRIHKCQQDQLHKIDLGNLLSWVEPAIINGTSKEHLNDNKWEISLIHQTDSKDFRNCIKGL